MIDTLLIAKFVFGNVQAKVYVIRCLVLIGSHIGENMYNGQAQETSEAIDNVATVIAVDPRYSAAASHSKYWLPIKPATDIALLLSWVHVIIYEDIYDRQYIEKYAYGFKELRDHVKNFTPEWAYGIKAIKPSMIRKIVQKRDGYGFSFYHCASDKACDMVWR